VEAPTDLGPDGAKSNVVRRRPAQQRSRERFDALVDAAGHLIGLRGIDEVSMTDIAERADVALTAAYRYFPNKQAVVRELALRSFEADDAFYRSFADRDDRTLRAWIEARMTSRAESGRISRKAPRRPASPRVRSMPILRTSM